jgi:hypothetical protein
MEQRRFGVTPLDVPVVGQGTWYLDDRPRPVAIAALRAGLDLGMTHIDTAEMYGEAELVVGAAIQHRREEFSWWTRCCRRTHQPRARSSPASARCSGSRPTVWTAICCTGAASIRSKKPSARSSSCAEAGSILSWGVSNFDEKDLDEAWRAGGRGRLACNQVLYHLKQRAIEHAVIPVVREARRCGRRLRPVRARRVSRPGHAGRHGAAGNRRPPPRHAAPGRAALPASLAQSFHHSRRPRHPSTPRRTPAPATFVLSSAELSLIDEAFPRGPKPRTLPVI